MAENDNINLDDTLATGDVYISEEQTDIEVIETVDVIEVEESESYEIDTLDAFPALGEDNENLRHALLNGREIADQHPITAITGLREELNEIKSLKTVYSDKINQADYYLWEDENILQEDRVGYFVSAHSDVHEIKICTSDNDIFGVTVDVAGFVGAQSDVKRDIKYGLVVTNGIVRVRCELFVNVGDYVISNDYGYAQKNDSGYRVVGRHKVDGIEYAEITLVTPISRFCELSSAVSALDERVDDAETNIVAAINVANEAHNKASEAIVISDEAIKNALESLDKSNAAVGKTDELESIVSSSNEAAVQAKAIAESAVVSAESIKNEAVADANKALAETSELRKELEATIDKIDTDLENTSLELEATKESLANAKTELQDSIDGAVKDIESLEKDLEPLATWPEGSENPTGIAGFVARADEDSATLASMVTWQGETNQSIAAFKQEVAENYATQAMVTAVGDNLALFKQEVADDYATQEMVTEVDNALTGYKQEVEKNYATQQMLSTVEDNLASYKQEVTDTYATQQMVTTVSDNLASYKQEVTDTYATQGMVSEVNNSLTSFKQEVADDYATQDMVTKVETDTSKALTDYKQEVSGTYATQKSLTDLETETTKAIAASEEKATETYASKSDLTSFESSTNMAMARIEQKADDNGASINSIVSNVDKYSVGEYSQSYGLTQEQASSILKDGMIYVPTKHKDTRSHSETFSDTEETNEFTPGSYYMWNGSDWVEYGNSVAFFSETPTPSNTLKYWYVDSNDAPEGYEAHALYKYEDGKWQKVNILDGNVNNRLAGMIRLTTDKIALEVVNARGSSATLTERIGKNEADIQGVVNWTKDPDGKQYNLATIKQTADDAGASITQVVSAVGEDGEVNAASIVTAINNGDSSVVIDADHVDISGVDVSLKGQTINISADDVLGISSTNFSVDTDGYITAQGGTIGGWTIDDDGLYSSNDDTPQTITETINSNNMTETSHDSGSTAYIVPLSNTVGSVLSISDDTGNVYDWEILDGQFIIYGDFYTTPFNSTVQYTTPVSNCGLWGTSNRNGVAIYAGSNVSTMTSAPFRVYHDGSLVATSATISGNITATSGRIGGCYISNGVLQIANANITSLNAEKITAGVLDADRIPELTVDKLIVGELKGFTLNACTMSACTLEGDITLGDEMFLRYKTSDGLSVLSFQDNGESAASFCVEHCLDYGLGTSQIFLTPYRIQLNVWGAGDEGNSESTSFIDIDQADNERLTLYSQSGYLKGSWYSESDISVTSDANKKNTVANIDDKYSVFFDNLVSRTFKYNDGTSDRLHTGFIAQEVKTALDCADLDTSEFGGLVIKQNADNTEDWYLRYGEFIALNTLQIQKLKARVAELERKIDELGE